MIEDQDLIDAGYREFPTPVGRYADRLFQKRFEVGGVTRYFVNVFQYDPIADREHPGASMAEAILYFHGTHRPWVTIELHYAESIEEVETFYDQVWTRMGFGPDPHNQRD